MVCTGYVYCACANGSDYIKIGSTSKPQRRYKELAAITAASQFDFFIFKPRASTTALHTEKALHTLLAPFHVEREVFRRGALHILLSVAPSLFEVSLDLDARTDTDAANAWSISSITRQVAPWMLAKGYLSIPRCLASGLLGKDGMHLATVHSTSTHSRYYDLHQKSSDKACLIFGAGAMFKDLDVAVGDTIVLSKHTDTLHISFVRHACN